MFRELIRALVCCLPVFVAGCSGSDSFTPGQARNFFALHEDQFKTLITQVAQCTGNGSISIYPAGDVMRDSDGTLRCAAKSKIAGELKSLDILWVNVSNEEPYGKPGPMGATFVLTSYGIVNHGSGSAIYYLPKLETNPFGDSIPLKGKPGHWFYRTY